MKQHNSIRLGQGFAAALITWLLIGLILGGLFSGQAFAVDEGDNFDDNFRDPRRWGTTDEEYGNGRLKEINQRLEYTCESGTEDDDAIRPWKLTALPYNADWEKKLDVGNGTRTTSDQQINSGPGSSSSSP